MENSFRGAGYVAPPPANLSGYDHLPPSAARSEVDAKATGALATPP